MTASAVALDNLLRRLTDTDRAAIRSRAPVHIRDQFDAAASHTERLFADMGHAMQSTVGALDYTNIPDWLRLRLVDTLARFAAGTLDVCRHAPRIDRPQPVVSAVWRPGLIACLPCIHLIKATGTDDRTCDKCGHVCAGLIHACSITYGPLIYFYGLCPRCMTEQERAQRNPTPAARSTDRAATNNTKEK